MGHAFLRRWGLGGTLLLLSCGGATEPEAPGTPSVAEVRIVSTVTSLVVGASAQLGAKAFDANGAELADRPIAWNSSSATVISVSTSGLASAHRAGSVTVTASSGGKSATLILESNPVPVGVVSVTIGQDTVIAGRTVQLAAVTTSASGELLGGRAVTWTTADPAIATVGLTGIVSGVSPGTAIVTATSEGVSGSANLEVLPTVATVVVTPNAATLIEGESIELSVALSDAAGGPLTGRLVSWSSESPGIASVSSDGVVTAVAPGAAQITVRSETAEAFANIVVDPVPVASVVVSPEAATIVVGGGLTFTPTAYDATGELLAGRPFTVDVDPPGILSQPAIFSVMGAGEGVAAVTFTSGAAAADASVRVVRVTYDSVDAGSVFTCGLATNGLALCWGNPAGYLGVDRLPRGIAGDPAFDEIRAGDDFSCGLAGGEVSCWGTLPLTSELTHEPQPVPGAPEFATIDVGQASACGLAADGAAYCWGHNGVGQLGDGSTTNSETPVAVAGGHTFIALSVAGVHACGLVGSGQVYCWGGATRATTPRLVSGTVEFASITAGFCGLDASGTAYCWDDVDSEPVPVAQDGGPFVALTSSSLFHRCGLVAGGAAYCWGANSQGTLGTGDLVGSNSPRAVVGGHTFARLSAGVNHTCGITTGKRLYCWGYGGAIGSSSPLEPVTVPALVTGQP